MKRNSGGRWFDWRGKGLACALVLLLGTLLAALFAIVPRAVTPLPLWAVLLIAVPAALACVYAQERS